MMEVKVKIHMVTGFEAKIIKTANKNVWRMAAYTRQVAKNSIKNIGKRVAKQYLKRGLKPPASRPGSPPWNRIGTLRRYIRYEWDTSQKTAVIGPILIPGGHTAVSALEKGGRSRIFDQLIQDYRSVYIRRRPYMSTALKVAMKRLSFYFKDTLGKGLF